MENIIVIRKHNGQDVVSAFELYKKLGYAKGKFHRWGEKYITKNDFAIYGVDYNSLDLKDEQLIINSTIESNNAKDYVLSIDFAKRLCMLARTEWGEKVRNYFIEVEKQAFNNQISNTKSEVLNLFKDYLTTKKQLDHHKAQRRHYNRLVYRDSVNLQQTEAKIENFLLGDESMQLSLWNNGLNT